MTRQITVATTGTKKTVIAAGEATIAEVIEESGINVVGGIWLLSGTTVSPSMYQYSLDRFSNEVATLGESITLSNMPKMDNAR